MDKNNFGYCRRGGPFSGIRLCQYQTAGEISAGNGRVATYQDSVAAASCPAVPAADSAAGGVAESVVAASGETAASRSGGGFGPDRQRRIAAMGEYRPRRRRQSLKSLRWENEVMTVRFSTRGGADHGRDAQGLHQVRTPRSARPTDRADRADFHRERPVRHVVHVKNGLNNVKVNTMDYVFRAEPWRRQAYPACDDASCGGGERMARIRVPYI